MDWSDIVLQIFAGVIVADIVSGVVHWFEDTYGDPDWPIIGKSVIEPNIIHHSDPMKFTRAPFWKRNRAVAPIFALALLGVVLAGAFNAFTLSMLIAGALASECHRWAHLPKERVPRIVRALQHVGVLQSTAHHWSHHRHGFNTHYCTVTNVTNPFLDGLRVFRLIEGALEGAFGLKPRYDREAYSHPMLGRRWIDRARRVTCAFAYQIRRRMNAAAPFLAAVG